mgnify:FL=1
MSTIDMRSLSLAGLIRAFLVGALMTFLCLRGVVFLLQIVIIFFLGLLPFWRSSFEPYGGVASYFLNTALPRSIYYLTSGLWWLILLGGMMGVSIRLILHLTEPRRPERAVFFLIIGTVFVGIEMIQGLPGDSFWVAVQSVLWICVIFACSKIMNREARER